MNLEQFMDYLLYSMDRGLNTRENDNLRIKLKVFTLLGIPKMNGRPKNQLLLLFAIVPIKKGWETEKNVVMKSLFMENSLRRQNFYVTYYEQIIQ